MRTVVFAQSTTHARLMIEYVFGMNSVVGHPVLAEASSPTTPEQQRLATLRATKERAAVALARKLAVLLHRLWISDQKYSSFYRTAAKDAA